MKKMKLLRGILAVGIGVGMLGAMTIMASANSQYSSVRANSVRLVWRRSMGQHTYTATQGARYSKHLGVRYSNNDVTPTVTWYTDAHEKLYRKNKGSSAIYYHVKSADGTLQGWIWRGYLKKTGRTSSTTTTTNKGTNQATTNYDTLAKNAILSLGGGAKPDARTMQMAKSILNTLLDSNVHFVTQAELYPYDPERANDTDVVLRNSSASDEMDSADRYLYNILKGYGIQGAGYGANKARTVFQIRKGLDSDTMRGYFEPSGDFYGQQGLTQKNFFAEAKIGVAVTKTSDGRTAMFAVLRFPDKYSKLVVRD